MKQAYQQYISYFRLVKKSDNGIHDDEWIIRKLVEPLVQNKYEQILPDFQSESLVRLDAASLETQNTHFYLKDDEFLDWLIDCTPEIKEENFDSIINLIGEHRNGIFHFPTQSKFVCFIACAVRGDGLIEAPPNHTLEEAKGKKAVGISFSYHQKKLFGNVFAFHNPGHPFNNFLNYGIYGKLLSGLGTYVSCFPECIIDGPPDDVKHPSHHQNPITRTIGISPKIQLTTSRGEITPHFRRGHFRVLRSPKFTNKRFQSVFVHQAFVKGKAVTVLSPEEIESK